MSTKTIKTDGNNITANYFSDDHFIDYPMRMYGSISTGITPYALPLPLMFVYHHNDMDGVSSYAVTNFFMHFLYSDFAKNKIILRDFSINYEKSVPEKFNNHILNKSLVFILDYSFTEDTKYILDNLIEKECYIIWIDHHDSSINLCNKYDKYNNIMGIRCKAYSGALLTYLYFACYKMKKYENPDIPSFLNFISDYDTFTNKYPDENNCFKLAYDSQKDKCGFINKFIKDYMLNNEKEYYNDIAGALDAGEVIAKYEATSNEEYIDTWGFGSELEGIKCYCVNRKSNSKIFGDLFYKYPMVCVFSFTREGIYSYSIFSNDKNIDCSKIAEKYHGGGHKRAAGFSYPKNLFEGKEVW